jgi:Flp pilus assembly protein TadD/DNA repair exonuclease SbcCD ATPase subunit
MIRFLLCLILLFGSVSSLLASDPSEQFLSAYQSFENGMKLERDGNTQEALKKYHFAESLLVEISNKNPTWQKDVVEYRLKKTREGLTRLQDLPTSATTSPPGGGGVADNAAPTTPAGNEGPSITIVPPSASPNAKGLSAAVASSEVRRLRRQIADLKEQLQQSQDALTSQKTREKDLNSEEWVKKKADLDRELQSTKDQVASLKDQLHQRDTWGKDLKDLQKKLDDTVADKLAVEEQYQASEQKHETATLLLVHQLQEAQQKVAVGNDTKQKYEQLCSDVEKQKETIKQLQSDLEHSQKIAKESADKNGDLQKQLAAASSQLASAEGVQKKVSELQQKLDASQKDAAKAKTDADASKVEAKSAQESLRKDRDRFVADRLVIEEENARLSAQFNLLKSSSTEELGKSAAKSDQLTTEMSRIKSQLSDNAKELESAKAKLAEAEKSAAAQQAEAQRRELAAQNLKSVLEQQNASLQEQLKGAMERMSAMMDHGQDTAGLQVQIKKLQDQIDQNSKSYADAQSKLAQITSEKPALDKALQEKEVALADAKGEANKLRADLSAANQKITDLQKQNSATGDDRLRQLQDQLADLSKKSSEKDKALADLQKEEQGLRSELSAAQQKVSSLQGRDDEANKQLKDLQEQLRSKENDLALLRKKKGKALATQKSDEENTLLRGIVLREVKEEARKAQARRLMDEEMKRLNIQSQTLSDQITVLSSPAVQLTPEERALFKEGQLEVIDGSPEKMEASISAPISGVGQGAGNQITNQPSQEVPQPPSPPSGTPSPSSQKVSSAAKQSTDELPWQGKLKSSLAKAKESFDKQDFSSAENSFKEALAFSPDDYFVLSNLGVVEFQLGKMSEAEEFLKKAAAKSDKSSFALTTLGIVHYRQGRLPEAEKVLRKAISINPDDFTAHNYLGIVLAASGNPKAGESEIMKSLEINQQYADAHFNLAVIYATGKPPAKMMAKMHYTKAVELGAPPDPSLEKLVQ